MNGIIHACSHVNEDNCETNVTEKEIFRNIFHYLDVSDRRWYRWRCSRLSFSFYFEWSSRRKSSSWRSMALHREQKWINNAPDGSVRDKTERESSKALRRERAKPSKRSLLNISILMPSRLVFISSSRSLPRIGESLSGTQFMENLDQQLRYFINVKLTTDPLWEGVDIHLSGHLVWMSRRSTVSRSRSLCFPQTPGEGEHKIMEYIRYTRSQPGYNVNTRHCLYGLDADLVSHSTEAKEDYIWPNIL